jgi:hypothetical protein
MALLERRDAPALFKRRIVRQYFVRFHMGLMTSAAVGAGLLSSKLLLEAGVENVLLRYPLCVLAAYALFVGLVKLWVGYVLIRQTGSKSGIQTGAKPGKLLDGLDLIDGTGSWSPAPPANVPRFSGFHGGDAGGGGASDKWGVADSGGISLPGIDIDVDDGIGVVILLAAVVLAMFGAGAYLIYAAPELLPDIALNALLAPVLARAAKNAEARGWLESVLRATWIPAALILLLTVGLAFAIQRHCPEANKLADALNCPETLKR